MATTKRMERTREILRLDSLGISQRQIADSCGCSRNTVQETMIRSQVSGIHWPLPDGWDDARLTESLYPERRGTSRADAPHPSKVAPDFERIHKELARDGVNMKLLWTEYAGTCKAMGQHYLQYPQFCVRYRQFAQESKATMHIDHKPGEKCSVDWAGTTYDIVDEETGELVTVHLFVGVLDCSKYTFAMAFPSQQIACWVTAHVEMFKYFRGVPLIVVPDNCKTAVVKASLDDPQLNRTYVELAEHYHCAVVPARPYRPKDKPAAEKGVDIATTWILAALRNRVFFHLADLNQVIREKLEEINDKPFQKLTGSRRSAFLGEEMTALQPLPQTPFELSIWKSATVGFNYHVEVEKSFYSLPHRYIKYKVDIRLTLHTVEIFHKGLRLHSHVRHHGRPGYYATDPDHMPADHKAYQEWDGRRFRSWAARMGPNTCTVVEAILTSRQVEQQSYRACFALLKLADKHTGERLESACGKAISLLAPTFSVVKNILQSGQDLTVPESAPLDPNPKTHRNIRGDDYYARQAREMQERQMDVDEFRRNQEDSTTC